MKKENSSLMSFLLLLSLSFLASSKSHGNPASEMVNVLNQNRTAWKLGKLHESPGLGCIALQYAELCEGDCNVNNNTLTCEPPEDDFTQVFAPNCGVELPTFVMVGQTLPFLWKPMAGESNKEKAATAEQCTHDFYASSQQLSGHSFVYLYTSHHRVVSLTQIMKDNPVVAEMIYWKTWDESFKDIYGVCKQQERSRVSGDK
ncbi:hypothetical protein HID58_037149 [Brassica napus]|uniref:Uncharacterized protein n=1 Tax=Brassica napus TaxID=3708 RepID=A0ABQ8BKG0_BRANA|nr:hypothetical protein HID58_037149 [Brassica napus]